MHHLAALLGEQNSALADGLAQLTAHLADSLTGYLGLQIVILHTGHPVVLSVVHEAVDAAGVTVDDGTDVGIARPPAATSVRIPLLHAGLEAGSRAVVYSRTPGALVDLAADLTYAVHGTAVRSGGPASDPDSVELDADLPFTAAQTGITGLDELDVIQQAVGMLILDGHPPDTAAQALRDGAAQAGLTPVVYASRLQHERRVWAGDDPPLPD